MNKIYKVMYSKVKQCAVVVSEIAKSHGHNGESSSVRKHAALMAAVLIALGSLSFTTGFMPMTAEAAITKTKTDGADFVGVERTDGLIEDKYANHKGQGAHGDDSITVGMKAIAGDGTITIGDRRAARSLGSVYVGRGPGMPTGDVLPDKTDDGYWATSVGYQSDATGYGSIAIGSNATANNSYDKDSTGHGITLRTTSGDGKTFVLNGKPDIQRASVAIGYGANADNGNIAIGSYSDASTDLRTATTTDGKEIKSYLTDTKADSYVSVGKSDALRRISNVADGAADSDVATIGQLKALSDKAGVYNEGWGIKIADEKDNNGKVTKKNAISVDRNLGTNLDTTGHVHLDVSKTGLVLGTVVDGAPGTDVDLHYGATGDYAVTVGGGANTASGKASVVIGGSGNTASDEAAVSSGGSSNVASGSMAAVYGGFDNEASGTYASIFAGAQNKASNMWTTVGGGALNEASGIYASVWGGSGNKATDNSAAVYGGLGNSAYGPYSAILGGGSNKAGGAAVVSGGASNEAAGVESAVLGGVGNIVTGANATAVGGAKGSVNGVGSVGILGGSTGINAPFTLAAGYQSTVTDTGVTSTPITEEEAEKFQEEGTHPGLLVGSNDPNNLSFKILDHFATAVGYQATADEAQTVAFGHDKGDTYYGTTTYTWKQKATVKDGHYYDEYGSEINEDSYKSLMNADGTWNDYSQPIATVEEKKYDSAYYNRLVKVADGIDDHDVVVMEQLDKAKNDLKVNAGWGINIKDETTQNADGTETTTKNVISLNRNLGTNYGNALEAYGGKGKITFEAAGENSLILGGGARNTDWDYKDKDRALGAFQKDSVLVGGLNNTVSKPTDTTDEQEGSVIVGGTDNTASGYYTLINGGQSNIANGYNNVVSGGYKNTATSTYSVATGGVSNEASGWASVVIGGDANKSTSSESIVAGGYKNQSTGINSSVFGGLLDEASGFGATAVGGNGTKAIGEAATGLGGQANFAIGSKSTIAGGGGNVTVGETSSAFGGMQNLVTGAAASAFGGYKSTVNGLFSTGVAGGSTDDEAVLSLAAGSQAIVTNSGVEKTYLTGEEYYQIATDINNGKKDLTGFYIYDPTYDGSAPGDMRYIHYDKPSTAIGYQATADTPGVVAFGHDKGDVSSVKKTWKQKATKEGNDVDGYKYYDANHKEITQEDYFKLANGDGTWNDYTQDPIGTETKTYDSAYYNRLVKVADGIDDHDVVVMEQLKQYAEKDASNIGNNIKVYKTDANGNVQLGDDKKPIEDEDATTTAQKANKDAWGKALGAGTFTTGTSDKATDASTSDQMVTGKTLYNYDKPTGTPNYVSANNTTGQNLSALDAQVKANADTLNDKTHNIKYYSVDENLPKIDGYTNEGNDGAKGMGSIAAGFNTHADGIASTVAGSYSGVINSKTAGLDLRGATALSYGTFNINQNTDATKEHSGVANSIVGQANATIDSNAAIIYGAGNTVTNSYRAIDTSMFNLGKVEQDIARKDAAAVAKDLQQAVPTSGGQVMVMGGGNSVDKAYMTQVTGVGNKVSGQDSTYAEGTSTQYNFVDGFQNELSNGKNDYIIGTNNKVSGDSVDKNQSNIIFGDNHKLTNQKNNVIIGSSDEVTEMAGSDAVSIGHNANAGGASVALGSNAVAGGNALAVGPNANAKNNSIALGIHASATSSQNLAIGYYANVTGRPDTIKNSVALGSSSTVGEKDILSTDNEKGVLSIGAKDNERRIIHVRAGVNDTDAVNVSQLKSVQSGLTDKGLTFVTNDGEHTAKLGSKVTIQGTAKKADHEYTADNLTTAIDKDGNITILMDKDMSTEKLTVNGKDGKDGQPGTAGSIGIKGQDGEAGIGIDGKNGISIKGKDGKDGVTMKAVDGKDGTEGHIGLTGPKGTNGKDGTNAIDITVKNGYDGENGINGKNGIDGTSLTRIVYTDKTGEHQVATLEDGLKFKGDDETVIAKKLNNTMEIIGGADSKNLTDGNIGVNSTDKGQLKVQLAKDLMGITSISNQKTEGDKTTGAKITLGNDGSVDVNGGKMTNVGSGIEADENGKYTVTDQNKGNAANIGDVRNMVNDAKTELTDGANGLNKKANIDASNIGANLKGADGKTASAEDQKTNAENWGSAIGTGKIEANDGRMVTGQTVYNEVRPTKDGSYVKKNQTTGANLSALDTKIGSLDKDGNYIHKDASISSNLSTLDTQVKSNADAISKEKQDRENAITNITNNIGDLSDSAVKYDAGTNKGKVTLASADGTMITNLKAGEVTEKSKDAVNGSQLYAEQKARTDADNKLTSDLAAETQARTAADTAINNKIGSLDANGNYIKKDDSISKNLSALDTNLKTTSDLIHTNDKRDTIQIGGSSTATKIDVHGKDGKGRAITGVVTDMADPTSAANVGYVNGVTAANTQQIYRDMNNAYGRLNNNINKAAAGSNALAALHPLDYDPDDKADFAVGYGHYRNANAAAVGAFYHPNENTMVNVGVSLGNGDPGFNAGVSFKIGSGSAGHQAMSKTEMAKVINSQSKEIDALKKDNADKDKRIDALEQKMAEILAKLDKNGK